MRFQTRVLIAAPRERVFAYLDDPELLKKWLGGFQELVFEKPGIPRAVGTLFRLRIRAGLRATNYAGGVIAYRPPGEFGVRCETEKVAYTLTLRLVGEGEGTWVEQLTEVEPRGWPGHLVVGAGGWMLRRYQAQALENLRAAVHRAAGPSAS
jgi:uncharacterized protein YndB with AHSA1/START domain